MRSYREFYVRFKQHICISLRHLNVYSTFLCTILHQQLCNNDLVAPSGASIAILQPQSLPLYMHLYIFNHCINVFNAKTTEKKPEGNNTVKEQTSDALINIF